MTYSSKELAHIPDPMRTLRKLRRAYKLTQAELAAMIDVHKTTLTRWETGKTNPRGSNLRRLQDFADRWEDHFSS